MEGTARKPPGTVGTKRKRAASRRAGRDVSAAIHPGKHVGDIFSHYVERVRRANPMDVMEMEREGVPGVLIKQLGVRINVPQQRLYRILGAPKATVERKAASNTFVAGAAGQTALGMVRLVALAKEMVGRSTASEAKGFDTEKWLGEWIETPQPALGGHRPSDMLDTPTGLAIVEKTLGALESGAYL